MFLIFTEHFVKIKRMQFVVVTHFTFSKNRYIWDLNVVLGHIGILSIYVILINCSVPFSTRKIYISEYLQPINNVCAINSK